MTTRSRRATGAWTAVALALLPGATAAQLRVSGTGFASFLIHQVNIGAGVEQSTGVVLGAEGALNVGSRLVFAAHASGGSLSTQAAGGQNRNVGEIGVAATVVTVRWLALMGGVTSRTYTTDIARQRWTTVALGAEACTDFAAARVRGVVRGAVLPVVSVTGLPGPDVALTGSAGLEYSAGRIVGGLFYGVERYDFPPSGAVRRLEQVSSLTVRVAIRRGGWPTAP